MVRQQQAWEHREGTVSGQVSNGNLPAQIINSSFSLLVQWDKIQKDDKLDIKNRHGCH